jgi:hypothetical protein
MAGRRQAWCPRCDELRAARPGTACPVCGRGLLPVPPGLPGHDRPGLADRAGERLQALLPAARAAAAGLLLVVTVGVGFAAGRLTRATPSAPVAPPTTSAEAGFGDSGPLLGRRQLNWPAAGGGLGVTLRSVAVDAGFTRLELTVAGLGRGQRVVALEGLRILDAAGNDLLPGGEIDRINTVGRSRGLAPGQQTEVVLDQAIDHNALARVQVRGLTLAVEVDEQLLGSLADPELQRNFREDPGSLDQRTRCQGCRVRVRCVGCHTVRVAATAYRHGRVLLLLQPVGPPERSAVNDTGRQLLVTPAEVAGGELTAWVGGDSGGGVVVTFSGHELIGVAGDAAGDRPVGFEVHLEALAERAVRGPWVIAEPGRAP